MTLDEPRIDQARRRGKKYALAVFVVIASAFVVSSTWQIMVGVFGLSDARAAGTSHAVQCADAIHSLEKALDHARTAAAAAHDEDEAARTFNAAIDPASLAAVDARCADSEDFHAAARRLTSATETAVRRLAREAARVQADVDRVLPASGAPAPAAP